MYENLIKTIKFRARVLADIRDFFSSLGYTEADVPMLTPGAIPEATIELFKTEQLNPYGDSRELFLLPSPEYYLKQLVAEGSGDIFCIAHSFRNSEQRGAWHNPEFSMLEYYTIDADYMDSISITEDFFDHMLNSTASPCPELIPPFTRMSMTEVFDRFASFDLSKHCSGELSPDEERALLREKAHTLGLSVSNNDSWEELFNLIFVHKVEPNLPADKPLVIYNYPSGIPALAAAAKEPGRLERWELYAGGIELANCYSEEIDYNRVKNFFNKEATEKNTALVPVKPDYNWCEMYKYTFPRCSGTALGVDRLMMMLSGQPSIDGVILFPLL